MIPSRDTRASTPGQARACVGPTRRPRNPAVIVAGPVDSGPETRPPPPPTRTHHALYRLCLAGREPAESLPTVERARLVAELHDAGWTDQQIADHTRMTLYTTARIRRRVRGRGTG